MKVLYALISAISPIEVIYADDNGPRPNRPYMALKIRSAKVNQPSNKGPLISDDGDKGGRVVSSSRDAPFEMQFFSEDPMRDASDLVARLQLEEAQDLASSLNVSLVSFSMAQNLPALRDNAKYEPRAIVEGLYRFTHEIEERVHIFEQVEINAK